MTSQSSSNARLLERYGDESAASFFPTETTIDEDSVHVSESELSRVAAKYARTRSTIDGKLTFLKFEVTGQPRNPLPFLHAMARNTFRFVRKVFQT